MQKQCGFAAMVVERMDVDCIGMSRRNRIGERARFGVLGALRILPAQRLKLAERARGVAESKRGARANRYPRPDCVRQAPPPRLARRRGVPA